MEATLVKNNTEYLDLGKCLSLKITQYLQFKISIILSFQCLEQFFFSTWSKMLSFAPTLITFTLTFLVPKTVILLEPIYMSAIIICKVKVFFRQSACKSVSPIFLKKLDETFSGILIFTTSIMVLLNVTTK